MAIDAVGKILEPYARKDQFELLGFGGIPSFLGEQKVNHCFSLESSGQRAEGLDNILDLYRHAIQNTILNGPTYFAPILEHKLEQLKESQGEQVYHITLFLTDGSIHDMRDTKDVLVELSNYPISVIIIGVGDADFTNMIELDGDEEILRNSQFQATTRDIV